MTDEPPPAEVAASAFHRLVRTLVTREVDDVTLAELARTLDAIADRLASQPPRDTEHAFRKRMLQRQARREGLIGEPETPDGDRVAFFPMSPVGGTHHPGNLGLAVNRDGDRARGTVTFDESAEGAPGRAHGGLIAACVDEMFAGLLTVAEVFAYTGELTVRYVGPCPVGEEIAFEAWVEGGSGRKVDLSCEGRCGGAVVVAARGIAVRNPDAPARGSRPPRPEVRPHCLPPSDADEPRPFFHPLDI